MPSATLARYWHTVRYLRPVQIYGRLWFRLVVPRPDLRPAPALRIVHATWRNCRRAASMTGPATFRLLGVERVLASSSDWNRDDWAKLWLYNAHYFDDLAASDAQERATWHRGLIARWIAENAPGLGNGWEPYPTSLRVVNWVKWGLAGHTIDDVTRDSLAVQVRFLHQRLEVHLLGNHLWANAKALLFAGVYFEGNEADGWREKGLALLRRELEEQILADGGHFERSPMYHAVLLEDVLDLVQLAMVFPGIVPEGDSERWRQTAVRMLHWLRVMSHPDGGIAFFNDAALGVAADVAALADYARSLGLTVSEAPLADIEALSESGYVRLQAGLAVLIADLAPIGPDYLPGHAHADTLSFELSLVGRRVLVNGGTSTYEADVQRMRERGTAMHNTVQVERTDSSEVWGSFRVARRARPTDVRWGRQGDALLWVEGAHDGYRRLSGRVVHRRRWELRPSELRLMDTLVGTFNDAVARFRFAPGLTLTRASETDGWITGLDVPLRWRSRGASSAIVASSTWHPRFGTSEDIEELTLTFGGPTLESEFLWE